MSLTRVKQALSLFAATIMLAASMPATTFAAQPDAQNNHEVVAQTAQTIRVSKVRLSKQRVTLQIRKGLRLKANVYPKAAANKRVTWKSSDRKVATVSTNGYVKALKVGRTVITATSRDGKKVGRCVVKVVAPIVKPNPQPAPAQPTPAPAEPEPEPPGITQNVWISRTGSKYHSSPSCSNMKSSSQVTLDEAIRRGYTACSKCW